MLSPAFYAQSVLVGSLALAVVGYFVADHQKTVRVEEARLVQAGIQRDQAAAIARQEQDTLRANLQPLPRSGEYDQKPWRQYAHDEPPFKVTASSGANYFIKLTDWQTGVPVMKIFVRAGEHVKLGVPPGTYRVKFASGKQWYGEDIRFGPDTDYSMVGIPSVFSVQGDRLNGHELTLELVHNGNLRRQPIKAVEF